MQYLILSGSNIIYAKKGENMTHNEELTGHKIKFTIASVAFVFCTVWALIGVSDIKIVAATVAFICFLKAGIEMENCANEAHGH